MHIVYKLTFKSTKKSYIGYTGKGILERIHKHLINAQRGMDTHFYKALRLYGVEDLIIETIYSSSSKEDALKEEERAIDHYDTFKNGYNQTRGGSGGWSIPDSKLAQWKHKLSVNSKGIKNPKYCGISNQELLGIAVKFFIDNSNRLILARWREFSKRNGLPQTYTKHRFGGGNNNFLKALKEELDSQGIKHNESSFCLSNPERYSKEVNAKISTTLKGKSIAKNNKKKD
tara:strand:+ start:3577 stop:4266 length:690 start_codon:yes stop_codon:yes gene_type:complete